LHWKKDSKPFIKNHQPVGYSVGRFTNLMLNAFICKQNDLYVHRHHLCVHGDQKAGLSRVNGQEFAYITPAPCAMKFAKYNHRV
jgi:hypothetical protein